MDTIKKTLGLWVMIDQLIPAGTETRAAMNLLYEDAANELAQAVLDLTLAVAEETRKDKEVLNELGI